MSTNKGVFKKIFLCAIFALVLAFVFTGCELKDPVKGDVYKIRDNNDNYYNKDHTTGEQAVNEFTDSITALRKYLDSESFVDSGYYMGVDFDIDILDPDGNTAGHFTLGVKAYLYTYPYEDENGNPIYKYYENGVFYDENNEEGTRTLVSALEIHNEAIKRSDFTIEWKDGATNEVLIGLYFDGVNSNEENPGNVLYANVQGYKRSFPEFGDTVLYQQMIRLLVNLSVEGLLESLGLQGDAGTGAINSTMVSLIGQNYKRVVNDDQISLYFYSVTLDAIAQNVNDMIDKLLGVFGKKWDPMTKKFLGFKFSTVANALVQTIDADMQAIVSPDKSGVTNVLTNAAFDFRGVVNSYDTLYTYTSKIRFDYGWTYPDTIGLDTDYYTPFDYGKYEFDGLLYVPSWDAQFDAEIKTDMQQHDNSTNNVLMEFRDIANGELMIGVYYREERSWLDISGLSYMYGWVDVEALGFPQVYDEHLDLAEILGKFYRMCNDMIVKIVDSILNPASSDKQNKVLEYLMAKTSFTEKIASDIFSINSETLQVDIELIKQMLEETGVGTFSTRQIINILDSMLPYTLDQIAIMLGIASAEIMLEKTYFTLTWDVDKQEFTIKMFTNVGIAAGEPSNMLFSLELVPVKFGEAVKIKEVDFSNFKPLREIYTYSGTLRGTFIFSSQETVDLSKLLSATIGESSGLNTPYVLATNAGLTFNLIYDQFVKDQYVDGRLKKAKRSAFELTVWLTGSDESEIIIGLASDDVCFDNEVYKDLPAREAELGYVWVNIACVTKNGTQVIPKVKIREDVFMASMSAYMNNQTSIEDDVMSFADNDFNLSLTSIITALCKDAYVIPAADKLEITSSNETLQNLFRVNGLIGNIKVDAGFDYRVKGLESIRLQYYMYEVGFFDNIVGNSPYDTALHDKLPVYFYEDYMDEYDPLKYDFLVYKDSVVLDDDAGTIYAGTIYLYQLGARRSVARQTIDYGSSSFFNKEDDNNQDIYRTKFVLDELVLDPSKEKVKDNMLVYETDGKYYYRTYYGKQRQVKSEYIETGADGTVYVYWQGITEVLFHDSGANFYYFDRNRAIEDADGNHAYISKKTDRNLLFEYDPDSVAVTEACKTQYAPRTNGSFMGEVRRYFVVFESKDNGELGKVDTLYYDESTGYPQYYSKEDEENVVEVYDKDGVLISSTKTPISLYVMEPCEPLAEKTRVNVMTDGMTTQLKSFNSQYVIDWDVASKDKKGYMTVTDVIIAPGMMGETTFPVRIIVTNREIDTRDYVTVYTEDGMCTSTPVVDEIDVDPYDYAMKKYAYLSDTSNFNPAVLHSREATEQGYAEAVKKFSEQYFSQDKYAFEIAFLWMQSYLFVNNVGDKYVAKKYLSNDNGVITKYNWEFDNEPGENRESSISPSGGTIYLHTTFKGQLIALKVNIGKREFSHLKFYDDDDFDPNTYNSDDDEVKINGLYRGNYYDSSTYKIDGRPIFVFTDGASEYEYVFDMSVVRGLLKNSDETYSGAYSVESSYSLSWGNPYVTNVTSNGSGYAEYGYSYLYDKSFTELELRYEALTDAQRTKLVKVISLSGGSAVVTEENLYIKNSSSGRAMKRSQVKYAQLASEYGLDKTALEGTVFTTEYGTGKATKYSSDRKGYAMIRNTDVEGETELINRPFYYFYDKLDPSTAVYLNEQEYEKYLSGDAEMRAKYGFNTDITENVTTAGLDLYYLFRLYFSLDNQLYAISTLSNGIIEPDKLNDQAVGATDFSLIELRISADCPQLDVDEAEEENDELTGETFTMNRVEEINPAVSGGAQGYYRVDPLDAETLYLPDSMRVFFKYQNFTSSHVFSGLEWCAYFDADGNPVYTYVDKEDGSVKPLIDVVNEGGRTRYKIAIDVKTRTEELVFRAMFKIGNAVSGYREVSVAVKILSKDPLNVDFYDDGNNLLDTPKTKTEIVSGGSITKLTYYTYYVNTFENFKLPSRLTATFVGHTRDYTPTWRVSKTGGSFSFRPDSLVTLVTTIGTEGGVTVDIYLVVCVENYELADIEVNNEFGLYYVTVENESGTIREEKVQIKEMFNVSYRELGYYMQDSQRWYIHVSTGAASDDVAGGEIALYSLGEESGRPIFETSVGLYEFISTLYSRATLKLKKNEMNFDKQSIIGQNESINDLSVRMRSALGTTANYPLSLAAKVAYSYKDGSDLMTISIGYKTAAGEEFFADTDENGKLTIYSATSTRKIAYAELASYLINENLAVKYGDMRVVRVNGKSTGASGNPFNDNLSVFVGYNSDTKKIAYDAELGITEDGTIELRSSDGTTYVLSYKELTYRLERYYRYTRVVSGTEKVLSGKSIEINDLYKIMDVNDMLVGSGSTAPDDKYVVSLGTGTSSYDMKANLRFAGGYYLTSDDKGTTTIKVNVYSTAGAATYENGYVLGNNVSMTLTAVVNDGTGNTKIFSYNNSATDERLENWYVETIDGNPMNITGVSAGDVIQNIPAAAIYSTGKARQITLSALTSEGFRIKIHVEFEELTGALTGNFSGGNPDAPFTETKKFAIKDGLITVENVYDLVSPSVVEYLGSVDYLPTTLTVGVNGRQITVSNVEWKINSAWYGAKDSVLSKLTYKGTSGSGYVMATADVLGCSDGNGGKYGATRISVYIKVNSAEVTVLPWESEEYGNGLATETLNDGGKLTYRVYVDAYDDSDAVRSGVVRRDDSIVTGRERLWFVELPTAIPAMYSGGDVFEFTKVRYYYGGTREVSKIYFDYRGMNVEYMTSEDGDLTSVDATMLSERGLDLSVDLGLGQKLSVRFCFYNKRVKEVTPLVTYSRYTDSEGNAVKYALLSEENKALTIADSDVKTFTEDKDGFAMVANVSYYREQYYERDVNGNSARKEYDKLTAEEKSETIKGTGLYRFVRDGSIYTLETKLVYSDVSAVIDLDDETIRNAVYSDAENDLTLYQISLLGKVNTIRVETNLESVISAAQEIKSTIRSAATNVGIEPNAGTSSAEISEKLLAWTKTVSYKGSYNENLLPKTEAFSQEQSYNYALASLIEEATALAYYDASTGKAGEVVEAIKKTIDGGGTKTAKQKSIDERVSSYFDTFTQNGYNAAIRKLVEREYAKLLGEEISGLTDERYNDAIYYKNMIEAGFDADEVLKDVYKLRSLKNAGTDVLLALQQIDVSLAEADGFGFEVVYEDYLIDRRKVRYDSLRQEEKDARVTYGRGKSIKLYKQGADGNTLVATKKYTYEKLAYAAFVQALFEAYEYADGLMSVKDENFAVIRETVIKLLENRLDIGAARGGSEESYAGAKNKTYTVNTFASVWAYATGDGSQKFMYSKKAMRTYLINVMREAATFTESKETDGAAWSEFVALSDSVVAYSYNYIDNYATTVNSIRRSLTSGTSITSVLRNLIAAGIKSYTRNVYLEAEYMNAIKDVQSINGQILAADKYEGGYSVEKFNELIDEYTARYVIEPYYAYRAVPHKIIVFFTGDDSVDDESGRPYETTIEWTTDEVSGATSYLGREGVIVGTITAPVTGETKAIYVAAAVTARLLEDKDKIVTAQYAEDGIAYARKETGGEEPTSDKKYLMKEGGGASANTVFFYEYEYDASGNARPGAVRYTLAYSTRNGVKKIDKFSGYDSTSTIVYSLVNEYDDDGNVSAQSMYVFNPFEFRSEEDMPSAMVIGGESMKIKWDKVSVQPTGNVAAVSDGGKATVSGRIGSDAGQTVELNMYVAQWSYAGMYRRTEIETGIEFVVDSAVERFVYMGALNIYFSAYSSYSAEDYYLMTFGVKIYMPDASGVKAVRRIVFEQNGEVYDAVIRTSDDGFVRKLFYPEDSRLLEYGLDDESMEIVNGRKRYVIYWETMRKNQAISGQTTVSGCNISLGNSDVGQVSLDGLRALGDNTAPTKATYGCERMTIDRMSFVTAGEHVAEIDGDTLTVTCEESGVTYVLDVAGGEFVCSECGARTAAAALGTNKWKLVCGNAACNGSKVAFTAELVGETVTVKCENRACKLLEEISATVLAQRGQAPVVISPDGYFPTTGDVKLNEINVSYRKEELRVRYLWNNGYDAVLNGLVSFVRYAYPDVEDASIRTYAKNLLMTWDIISESERREIIENAKAYERALNDYRGEAYTEELCTRDAYALLAINERFDYSKEKERLRGGGNNNVRVTVLIGVEGSTEIYSVETNVKVLFADYSPIGYYEKKGSVYESVASLSKAEYLKALERGRPFCPEIYISVRKEYWNENKNESRYATDGAQEHYDKIGDDMYKLLQVYAERTALAKYGVTHEKITGADGNEQLLVKITDIEWAYDEKTSRISSEKFTLDGTVYEYNLLQLILK